MRQALSYQGLVPIALLVGLAPFHPRPHLVARVQMLMNGSLSRPIDAFDLVLHGGPVVLLLWRVLGDLRAGAHGAAR